MNGAQNGTPGPEWGPNGADLDVVLGRFQSWAATQRTPERTKAKASGGKLADGSGKLADGVREISYEQALRASSYRRFAETASIPTARPPVAETSTVPDEQLGLDGDNSSGKTSPRKPGLSSAEFPLPRPSETPPSKLKDRVSKELRSTAEIWPENRFAQALRAVTPDPPLAVESSPAVPFAFRAEDETALAPPPVSLPQAAAARASRRVSSSQAQTAKAPEADKALEAVGVPKAVKTRRRMSPTPPENSAMPSKVVQTASSMRRQARPRPSASTAIRDRLRDGGPKDELGLVAACRTSFSREGGKTAPLTLRVSDVEQTQIQARAAQANLSVSAYLRQCALSVEELRTQVDKALSSLQKQPVPLATLPGMGTIPGILRRFAKQLFRREKTRDAALSLR